MGRIMTLITTAPGSQASSWKFGESCRTGIGEPSEKYKIACPYTPSPNPFQPDFGISAKTDLVG
jgi:hypothetical protein